MKDLDQRAETKIEKVFEWVVVLAFATFAVMMFAKILIAINV